MVIVMSVFSLVAVYTVDGSTTWLRENKRRGGGIGGIETVLPLPTPLLPRRSRTLPDF